MSDEIREECGIFAVAGHPRAVEMTYYGLYALQHRGQESAGIAYRQGSKIRSHKGMGLVSDVLLPERIAGMSGDAALGHVRYSTAGESRIENAQPINVKMWRGQFALAHNGNLVNAGELRTNLEHQGSIFQTTSDSEVIPHLLARSPNGDMLDAFVSALSQIRGAYALAALTPEGIIAAKDPNGFRPLCLGIVDGAYVLASETCALDAVGAEFVRELDPGEIIQIVAPPGKGKGEVTLRRVQGTRAENPSLCVFEFIYFARPDSDIYGLNVHSARKALGRALAKKGPVEADLVTGVPDSSLSAASGYAEQAGIPYEMGLVKNRYVGRTFIAPEQSLREFAVKIKLNPLKSLIQGKRVVLVDDSIVRGTTSRYIIGLLRSAGAKEVHVRISSPPYKFPCFYGIDTSSRGELAASEMSVEDIRKAIGADSLVYLDLDDLEAVLGTKVKGFCYSCFTGDYPVDVSQCCCREEGGAQ
ncbi:MAG: amidophosphoribosyltransferase [Bacillota bacterium]